VKLRQAPANNKAYFRPLNRSSRFQEQGAIWPLQMTTPRESFRHPSHAAVLWETSLD
jgi:hypothetical protein